MHRLLLAALTATALALSACGSDEEPTGSVGAVGTTEPAPAPAEGLPEGCEPVEEPAPKEDGGAKPVSGTVKAGDKVLFDTSCGAFTIELDVDRAPKTARSFASLARQGFFDGTIFHRVIKGFVIQGGDPTASGSGGPGYSVEEAPPSDLSYVSGVVAMAKTPAEAPGTSGSQFYVVSGDATQLPPEYALAGKVVEGQDVVDRIAEVATSGPPTDRPTAAILVRSAKVV